jgi:hypothetical protein
MATALNGALEVGLRTLIVLDALFPRRTDIGRLVLYDYCLLHSGDFGGPDSVHPEAPLRSGELGVKRESLAAGLEVMIRSGLASLGASSDGMVFGATEETGPFIDLLRSPHSRDLRERAAWVVAKFGDLDELALRRETQSVVGAWDAEFEFSEETRPR